MFRKTQRESAGICEFRHEQHVHDKEGPEAVGRSSSSLSCLDVFLANSDSSIKHLCNPSFIQKFLFWPFNGIPPFVSAWVLVDGDNWLGFNKQARDVLHSLGFFDLLHS